MPGASGAFKVTINSGCTRVIPLAVIFLFVIFSGTLGASRVRCTSLIITSLIITSLSVTSVIVTAVTATILFAPIYCGKFVSIALDAAAGKHVRGRKLGMGLGRRNSGRLPARSAKIRQDLLRQDLAFAQGGKIIG